MQFKYTFAGFKMQPLQDFVKCSRDCVSTTAPSDIFSLVPPPHKTTQQLTLVVLN